MTDSVPDYRVSYYRNGIALPVEDNPTDIKYDRRLDDISRARIAYVLPGIDCCEQLGVLEPFADSLAVWLDGVLVWYGWIETIEYARDVVNVEAFDVLGWAQYRLVHTDLAFVGVDLVDIFEAVFDDAMSPGDVDFVLETAATGVTGDRTYLANNYRVAWDVLKELLSTGVDATVLGQRIIAGGLVLPTLEYGVDDFEGDLKITKRGTEYGNRFAVKGSNGVIGLFPPSGPLAGDAPYPLVERPVEDTNILDQASADSAAQTRAEFSQVVPRVFETPQGAKLKLCTTEDLQRLIPGAQVNFDSTGLCYEQRESFRLQQVEVQVNASAHSVGITLQPFGSGNLVA